MFQHLVKDNCLIYENNCVDWVNFFLKPEHICEAVTVSFHNLVLFRSSMNHLHFQHHSMDHQVSIQT